MNIRKELEKFIDTRPFDDKQLCGFCCKNFKIDSELLRASRTGSQAVF